MTRQTPTGAPPTPQDQTEAPFPLDGGRVGDGGGAASGKGARPKHAPGAIARARYLRREQTLAERMLWSELRKLKLNFRRQAPIGRYVVDFADHGARLVVEIDGYYHEAPDAKARDAARTTWLISQGYCVLRFAEAEVREALSTVLERIIAEAAPPPSPTLPPSRGKGDEPVLRRRGEPRYQAR